MTETAHTAPVAVPLPAPTTAQTATIVEPTPVERRRLGRSELSVFPVGLGARAFGTMLDAAQAEAVLDAFLAAGGDLVDTADAYAGGRSEAILGDWMRSRRVRDRITVSTKVGAGPDHPGVGARAITASVHESLRRLGTDRIDLLFLHVDDPEVDFEETLLAVDELILAGAVREFGLAAHPGTRLIEARIACAQLGIAPMVAVQPVYNLLRRREVERGISRIAQVQGLAILPRFALAGGVLAGNRAPRGGLRDVLTGRPVHQLLTVLGRIAEEVDGAMATVALAWLLSRPDIAAPIATATTADEVLDLVAAAQLRLTRRQLAELDRASLPFA